MLLKVQWAHLFLFAQRVAVKRNIIYQDNTSSILLEVNGKKSSGKRTRHINIRYFLTTSPVTIEKKVPKDFLRTSYRLPTNFTDFTLKSGKSHTKHTDLHRGIVPPTPFKCRILCGCRCYSRVWYGGNESGEHAGDQAA
jgi:hypothetical protein